MKIKYKINKLETIFRTNFIIKNPTQEQYNKIVELFEKKGYGVGKIYTPWSKKTSMYIGIDQSKTRAILTSESPIDKWSEPFKGYKVYSYEELFNTDI